MFKKCKANCQAHDNLYLRGNVFYYMVASKAYSIDFHSWDILFFSCFNSKTCFFSSMSNLFILMSSVIKTVYNQGVVS